MPVSPRDFELYSRMTGTPMPSDAMSRMQMAPEVHNFTKNFAKKPNLLEKTGNLVKNIGKGVVMAIGTPMVAESMAEQARMQEQLRNQPKVTGDSEVGVTSEPLTAGERLIDRKMRAKREEAEIDQKTRDDKQAKAIELLQIKKQDLVSTPKIEEEVQQPTTADNYQQDFVPNQTSSGLIDRKLEQGSQIADETPNVAEVLSESQDSRQSEFADPEDVQKQMKSDMEGSDLGKNQLAKFLSQKGLDQALLGAIGERMTPEPRIGDSSPLIDHPDLPGGEDDINLPSGTNTSPTENLSDFYQDMRKMEALERIAEKSPSTKQIALGEMNKSREGFMAQDGPNKPAYDAKQRILKKTAEKSKESVNQKSDDFMAKFVEGSQSDIVRGRRGNRSLGITRIPATNGDAQVGFVLANKPLDKSPKYATTYGFGVAPGAEGLLDNQLNQESFSDYMQRGLSEAKEGKKRKAGEIFEFLPPSARVVSGTARLGDIVM